MSRASDTGLPEPVDVPPRAPGLVWDLIYLCRPHHWTKNIFVLAPWLFSGGVWNPSLCFSSLAGLACFCLWSSSVYSLNDAVDAKADRTHPRKRERPVAAGRLTPAAAAALATGLAMTATVLSYAWLPPGFLLFGLLYAVNGVAYCLIFRNHVIADVLIIAIGFVLRLLAGCAAIDVEASSWLLVCGFSLALLLGFGKRRSEIALADRGSEFREVLATYTGQKLDVLLAISSSVCLLSYMLYTVAPETAERHGSHRLIYTVPFVAYGVFRYLFKAQEGAADSPVDLLLRDPVFAINGACWVAAVAAALYFP